MRESSKIGYTSTSNGYKWAIRHKLTKINCGSLVVQIYTQVLMKTTFKHVIKNHEVQKHKQKLIWSLCKCTCFRTKIYTIAKVKWEHKKINPYEHGYISKDYLRISHV